MKFLGVRDLRGRAAGVWEELEREREMVVTSNGRPIAILTAVGEDDVEEALAAWRKARAAVALAALQKSSVQAGRDRMSAADIGKEIASVRRARGKRRG
jgi:antitoxin (DNA-binding transcriptional repressor) of toxin-antitoxin stability system